MLNLTKQERLVLICLSFIMFAGSVLQYVFKKNPRLSRMVNLIDSPDGTTSRLYKKVDINTADFKQLVEIPYIGKVRAEEIIQHRRQHGKFRTVDQLKNIKGIGPSTYKKIAPFIKVQ